MGRKIAGVVAGYVVMFVAVFAAFSIAFVALGADRAFKPGSYDVTGLWLAVSTALSFVAALLGGWVAAAIGRNAQVPRLLAVVVVVLGVLLAIPSLNAPRPDVPRTDDVGNADAMMNARQPPAVALLNPVIGAVGVLAGGRMRKPRGVGPQAV
jgi:hypothetical protein